MMEGDACYYQGEEEGTSLLKLSKELDLKIEIYSSEPGMCFQEHYYIENGECVVGEETEYNEYWFEEDLTKEELEDEFNGSITEDEYLDYQESGYFSRGGFDWNFQHI